MKINYKNFTIEDDGNQFILIAILTHKKSGSKGKTTWQKGDKYEKVLGYYMSIENAVSALSRHHINNNNTKMELAEYVKAIKNEYSQFKLEIYESK